MLENPTEPCGEDELSPAQQRAAGSPVPMHRHREPLAQWCPGASPAFEVCLSCQPPRRGTAW